MALLPFFWVELCFSLLADDPRWLDLVFDPQGVCVLEMLAAQQAIPVGGRLRPLEEKPQLAPGELFNVRRIPAGVLVGVRYGEACGEEVPLPVSEKVLVNLGIQRARPKRSMVVA